MSSGVSSFAIPKSSSFGTRTFGDEDVARLDIPMNDQALMRVVNGIAQPAKQVETVVYRKITFLAVIEKQLAFDVLHNDIRAAVCCGPTIE